MLIGRTAAPGQRYSLLDELLHRPANALSNAGNFSPGARDGQPVQMLEKRLKPDSVGKKTPLTPALSRGQARLGELAT